LADHLLIGESNDKAVLWGLILVLILGAEAFTLAVIGTSLTATAEFDLIPREVRLALCDSAKYLLRYFISFDIEGEYYRWRMVDRNTGN